VSSFHMVVAVVVINKDAFSVIGNFFVRIYNSIVRLIKSGVGSLPDFDLKTVPKLKSFAEDIETGESEEVTDRPVSLRRQQAQERKEELRARAAAGDPNVVITTSRGGMIDDAQVAALDGMVATQQQQRNLTPPQTAGGGNVANAVVNAPSTTTNVNNATTVMDAEPAIDGLDRFAMGGAF